MKKRILLAMGAVVVGVPLLITAWFYIGGIETGDTSLPDDADLLWTPPEVADEDNALVAILAATNLVNTANFGTNESGIRNMPLGRWDMSFVGRYGHGDLIRFGSRSVREEPGAAEKADRILADNAAFYAAFAKGLERRGFRNAGPVDEVLGRQVLPIAGFMDLAWLWRLKIQREAERGEWSAAMNSLEVLCRFGRLVLNNAASFSDFVAGGIIERFALDKIVDLAAVEGAGEDALLRLAALADGDEAASASNCVRTVRGMYTDLVAELPKTSAVGLLRSLDCDSPFWRICPVLEHWPFYRGFALDERWTRRRLADVAHAFLLGETDLAADERFSLINPFVRNWNGRHQVNWFARTCRDLEKGSQMNKKMAFHRTRAQLVVAAARWRLSHDGKLPPALDALVPQYLPAVPVDPWSKDGRPLCYDAESGVAWSVGRWGNFNFVVMKNAKPIVQRSAKYSIREFAFPLDGKPLDLLDNVK